MHISNFCKDCNGKFSAARLLALTWGGGLFIVWAYLCIITGTLIPIPHEVSVVVLGFASLKTVQSFGEKKDDEHKSI